jgi:predicted  nucleic acid-binding Zn-ribbon protein
VQQERPSSIVDYYSKEETELKGAVSSLRSNNSELSSAVSRLEEDKVAKEARISDLEGQISFCNNENASLRRQLNESSEKARNGDLTIADLHRQIAERENGYAQEVARLNRQIETIQAEKIASEQSSGMQNQELSAQLAEKQRELENVTAELESYDTQLREAMSVLDNSSNFNCERLIAWGCAFLGAPTIIGTVKAAEWINHIEEPFKNATRTVEGVSIEIARLTREQQSLQAQLALMNESNIRRQTANT